LTRHIHIYFGATEIIGMALRSTFTKLDDLLWLTPDPTRKIRVVDRFGSDCSSGEEGELAIELADLDISSYLDDETASSKVFKNGFFHPGDLAVSNQDGKIRTLGRAGDVITIRGQKTSVSGIEQAIQNALKVDEVCLFSQQTDRGADEVVVAVRTRRTISALEIEHVTKEFLPFESVRVVTMSRFPKTFGGFGKTLRAELKRLVYGQTKTGRPSKLIS